MESLVMDLEGGASPDKHCACCRPVRRRKIFGGSDGRATAGLAETATRAAQVAALETKRDVMKQGFAGIADAGIADEPATALIV